MSKRVIIQNGYNIRDLIKQFGGAFRASDKAWVISQQGFDEVHKRASNSGYNVKTFDAYKAVTVYSEV